MYLFFFVGASLSTRFFLAAFSLALAHFSSSSSEYSTTWTEATCQSIISKWCAYHLLVYFLRHYLQMHYSLLRTVIKILPFWHNLSLSPSLSLPPPPPHLSLHRPTHHRPTLLSNQWLSTQLHKVFVWTRLWPWKCCITKCSCTRSTS